MAPAQILSLLVIVTTWQPVPAPPGFLPPPRPSPDEDPRLCSQDGEYCFSYDRNSIVAPQFWYRVCGTFKCFFGANQSPIFINPRSARQVCGYANKLRYNDTEEVDGTLQNVGTYADFKHIQTPPLLLGVPGFETSGFELDSIHIHIGRKGGARGSEHIFSGRNYDAEVHLVHKRGGASAEVAGIAVVALFLSTTSGEENSELSTLLDRVVKIQKYEGQVCRDFFTSCDEQENRVELIEEAIKGNGAKLAKLRRDLRLNKTGDGGSCGLDRLKNLDYLSTLVGANGGDIASQLTAIAAAIDSNYCRKQEEVCPRPLSGGAPCGGVHLSISPDSLLPKNRNYYYYYGSLTTPTLSESVIWNLMAQPLRITQRQLQALQALESRTPGTLISEFGNLRPIQRLREREVHFNVCG